MIIAVLADEAQKEELLSKNSAPGVEFYWAGNFKAFTSIDAYAYIDLQFVFDADRIDMLRSLSQKPVIVNSVVHTLMEIAAPFVRINGWPTMLSNAYVEACFHENSRLEILNEIFDALGWKVRQVPDVPGMVTPRVIAMIVNEARFVYDEGTSTETEIDTAMKLGTNYPFGPFEWGERIGLQRIVGLLEVLKDTESRYSIAPSLTALNK